jgi:serine/threonine protein kinase
MPPKIMHNTGAISTQPAPGENREYPAVPGYEILGVLGHGGMGVVYRARQLQANRLVALKMIRAVEHASPTERLRFQIETEAVARLQHSHIVQLYEAGEVRGRPFFSLEFCDGGTLTEQLKKQRPSPREAAGLIETLARAMHYAHLRGVVHRDLKPGNVLLAGPDRVAKITDFGLAKRIDAEAREISQSGAIMGTGAYMAPEQAAGKVRDTGPSADVYALGALLYECLTGRPPFVGPQHAVLVSVLNDEPVPPSRQGAKVPADLETICLKCLSKEPARRYASAEELANDLRRFRAGEPIRARAVGAAERVWKWARQWPVFADRTPGSNRSGARIGHGQGVAPLHERSGNCCAKPCLLAGQPFRRGRQFPWLGLSVAPARPAGEVGRYTSRVPMSLPTLQVRV